MEFNVMILGGDVIVIYRINNAQEAALFPHRECRSGLQTAF